MNFICPLDSKVSKGHLYVIKILAYFSLCTLHNPFPLNIKQCCYYKSLIRTTYILGKGNKSLDEGEISRLLEKKAKVVSDDEEYDTPPGIKLLLSQNFIQKDVES